MDRSVSVASSASAPPSERSDSTTDVNHVLPMSTWLQQTNNYHSNNSRRVHTGFSSSDSESSSTTRSENAARDPPPAMPMNTWLESVSTLAAGHQKVHTGFTSSDSESFSSASSSRDGGGGGEAAPVKLSVLFSRPQYVAGGPLPHTGFTTSESSASSRSSSPPGGAAAHHSKQMILDHAAKKNTTRPGPISTSTLVAEEGTRVRGGGGSGSDGAAVVTSSHDISQQSLGVMGTFQAVFPTRPSFTSFEAPQSVEPRKADATPRRKVSPSAGSSGNTPSRGLPSSTVQRVPLLDRRPLSEVDGAIGSNSNVNTSSTSMMTSSARLDPDRSALPPSTLLDLQANLSLQSDIRLRVREEELIKELSRTRRELLRRGMAMTAYMDDEMGLPQGGDGGGRKISVASLNPRQRHSQQQPEPSTEGGAAARSDYNNERVALDDGNTTVATSRGYSTRKSFTGEVLVTQPAPPSSSAAYLKEYAQRLLNITSHGGDYGFASSSVQSTPGAGAGQGPSNRQQQNTDTSLDRNAGGSDVEAEWVGRRDEGMQHASRQGSAVMHQWTSKKAVVGSNVLSTTNKHSNSYYTDHDHNVTTTATSSGALSPLLRSPILHVGKRQHYNEQSRPLTPRAISSSFSQQQHDVPATESAAVWSELLALKRIRETQR